MGDMGLVESRGFQGDVEELQKDPPARSLPRSCLCLLSIVVGPHGCRSCRRSRGSLVARTRPNSGGWTNGGHIPWP
jgi:hypothetical protein